ncbi:MAG: NUDIX hydrolase [candidate division Zixibacteria bacterium]|nr:NUDIX hydrolase [candidate division Zixibacteria bacterium]
MRTKDPISSFNNCPICTTKLTLTKHNHRQRKTCPACGFVDWHNPAPAAGVLVVNDGKLLMVKRSDEPRRGDWCIPAGFIEWDESPQECAVRELKEETGLDIALGKLFNVYCGVDDPRTNALLILYFGEIIGGNPTPGDDAAELAFFSREEIPENIAFAAHIQAIKDLQQNYPGVLK